LLVLFSLLYSPLDTLFYFWFPACAWDSFVLVDIIFGFLCSLGQTIILIFNGLLWFCLQVYMYICIFSHTFWCCYKLLHVHWAFAVLRSFPFFFPFFFLLFFLFFITLTFLNLLYFFYIYSFVCLSYCSFPFEPNL